MDVSTAIIIGSGFDSLLAEGTGKRPTTRFGVTSAPIHKATIEGRQVLTLARHGESHSIPPHAVNYRANLVALQEEGANAVIGLNTVGVVTPVREPGQLAVPDQVIDYTWGRESTIFDGSEGVVEHIDFTSPFSAALRHSLLAAAAQARIDCLDGGVYAATQGPRLETAAEVDRLERDGADFIGMTAMPEAAIAMELGLDYACVSMVVNRAAGRGEMPIHDDVEASTVRAREQVLALLQQFFLDAE